MGETVHIRVLGTSFSIQTDKKPEYVENLISYIQEKIRIIEASAGSKESLRTAILVSVLLADELFQERSGTVEHEREVTDADEIERYTQELIQRIDATLEEGQQADESENRR